MAILVKQLQPLKPLQPLQPLQAKQMLTPFSQLQPLVPLGVKDPYISYSEQQRRKRLKAIQESRYSINSLTDVLFNEAGKNQLIVGSYKYGNPYSMDYLSKAVISGISMMKKQFADPISRGDGVGFVTNGINMFSEDMDVLSNLTKSMVIESGSVDSSLIVGAVTGLAAGAATLLSGGTLAPVFFATTIAAGMGMVGNALVRDTEGALRGLEKASGSSALGKTNYNFDIKNGFVNLAAEIAIDPLNWLSYGQNLITNMADIWGITIGETTLKAINLLGSVDNLVTKVAVRTNPIGWIWKGAKAGYDFANSPAMRTFGVAMADLHEVLKDVPVSQVSGRINKEYNRVMGQKKAVLGRWAKTGELDALTDVDERAVFSWFSQSRDVLVHAGYSLSNAYETLKELAQNNMLYEFAPIGGVGMRDEVKTMLRDIMDDFDTTGVAKGVYYGATDPNQVKALDQWLQAMAEQTMAVDMVRDVMELKISPILDEANKELVKMNFGAVVTRGQKLDAFYKHLVVSDPAYTNLELLLKDNTGNRALDRALRVRGFSLDELYQRLKSPVNDAVEAEALLHDTPDFSSAVKPDGKLMADAERVRKYTQKSLEAAQEEMSLSGSQLYYGKVLDGRHEGSWDVSNAARESFYVKRAFEIEVDTAHNAMQGRGTNTYYMQMMDWKKKINDTNQTLFGPLREIRRNILSGPKGFSENLFRDFTYQEKKAFMDVTEAYEDLYYSIEHYDMKMNAYQRYIENPKGPKQEDPARVLAKANGVLRSLDKETWTKMMRKFQGTVTEDFMRTVFETIPQLGLKDAADALIKATDHAMVLQLNISRQIELIISEVTKSVIDGHSGIEMLQELLDTSDSNSMGRLLEALSGFDISATAEFAELGRVARNIKAQGEGFTNIMRYIKRITDVLDARNLQEPMKPTFLNMGLPVNVMTDDGALVSVVMDTADDMFTLRGMKDAITEELTQLDDPALVVAKQIQLDEVTRQIDDLKEAQYLALREAKQQVVDLQGRILADYANVKPLEQAYTQLFKPEGAAEIMDAADNAARAPLIARGEELVTQLDDINTQLDELEVLQGKVPVDINTKVTELHDNASLYSAPTDTEILSDPEHIYNKTFRENFLLEDNTALRRPSTQFSFQKGKGALISGADPERRALEWPDNKSFAFVKSVTRLLPSDTAVPTPVLAEFNRLIRLQPLGDYDINHLFDIALYKDADYATKYRQLQAVMPKRVKGVKEMLKPTKTGYLVNGMRNDSLTEAFLMKFYGSRMKLLAALKDGDKELIDMNAYKAYQSGASKTFIVKLKSGKNFTMIDDKKVLRIPGEMLADLRDKMGNLMDTAVVTKATTSMKETLQELYKYGYINKDLFKSNLDGSFPARLFFENDDPWSIFKSNTFGLDDQGMGTDAIGAGLMKLRADDIVKRTKWTGDTLVKPADANTLLKWGEAEDIGKGLKPVTTAQQLRFHREAMQQWITRNPKVLTAVLAYDEKALVSQFGLANYTMHIKPLRESLSLFFPERMLVTGDLKNVRYDILNWDVQEIQDFLRYNKNGVKVNEKDMYQLFVDVVQHYTPLKGVKMTVDAAFKKSSIEQKILNMMAEMSMFATRGKVWDPDFITVVGRDGTVYEGVKHITYSIAQAEKWARKQSKANSTILANDTLMMSRSIPRVVKEPVKEVTYAEYLTQVKDARLAVRSVKDEFDALPGYLKTMDAVVALRRERDRLSKLIPWRPHDVGPVKSEAEIALSAVQKKLKARKSVEDAVTALQEKLAKAQATLRDLEAHPVLKSADEAFPTSVVSAVVSKKEELVLEQLTKVRKDLDTAEQAVKRLTKERAKLSKDRAAKFKAGGFSYKGEVKGAFDNTKLVKAREKVELLKKQMSMLSEQKKSFIIPKLTPVTHLAESPKKSLIFNDEVQDVVVRPYTVHIPESTTDGLRTVYDETYLEDGTKQPSVEYINVPKFKPARDVTIKEHLSNTVQATGPRQFSADYWAGIKRAQTQKPKPYVKWNEWRAPKQEILIPKEYEDMASRVDLTNAKTDQTILAKFKEFTTKHQLATEPVGDDTLALQVRAKLQELARIQADNVRNNHLLANHAYQSNTLKNAALEKWYFETTGKHLNFWEIKKLANNPTELSPVEAALKELKAEGYHDGPGVVLSKKLSRLRPEGINVGPTLEMYNTDEDLKRRVYNYVFDTLIKHNDTPLKEANIILRDYTKLSEQITDVFPELTQYGGKALTDELQRVVYMFLDDQMKWAHLNTRLMNVVDVSFLQDMSTFIKRAPGFIAALNDPAFQQDALMEKFNTFKKLFMPQDNGFRTFVGKGGVTHSVTIPRAVDTFGSALNRVHDMNVKAATEYMINENPTLYNETAHAFGLTHIETNVHTSAISERQERTGKVFQDSEALMKRNLAIKEAKLGQPASLERGSKRLMRELTLTAGTNMDLALKSYKEVIDARWALASGDFTAIGRQDIADVITSAQVNSSDVFRNIEEMRRMAVRYPAEAGYFLKKVGLDVMAKREVAYIEQRLSAEELARYIYFHKPSHFWATSNDTITDGLNVGVLAELRNKYGMVVGGDAEFTTYRFLPGQETEALKALKPLTEMFEQSVSDLPGVMVKQGDLFDGKMQKGSGVLNPFHWTDSMRVRYDGDKLAAFYKARGFITEAESTQFIFDMQNQMNLWNNFTGSAVALKTVFGDRGFIGSPLNAMIATSTSLTTHGANRMTFLDNLVKGMWSLEEAFAAPGLPKPTPEQMLEAFKNIPSITAIVISEDMRMIELPIRNLGDVKVALDKKAFITAGDTISRMWNEFDNGKISPIIQGISNYTQGPYKAGYLSNLGLGMRNFGDNIKALIMMSRNNKDIMPFIPRAFKAVQDYQKILLKIDGMDDLGRAGYLLGLTDKQLVDYAVIRSASQTVMNTHLESIMDITVEARKASEIRQAIRGKNVDVLGMIWGNPLTRTALKVQGFGENLARAAGLFYALEVKGMGGSEAADFVNKYLFDYNKKGKAMSYLSAFVPFAFFPTKNFLLWAEEAEKNSALFRFFLDMGTQSWNGGVEDRGYAMTAYEQQQQISGNFKVGSTLIKFNPSLFDSMALIPDILQNPTKRLSPMINNIGKLMKGDIDGIELPFKLNYDRVSKIITNTIPKVIQGNVEEVPNLVPSLFSTNVASFKSPTTTYSYTTMSRRYGSSRIPRSSSYIKKVYLSKGFYNTLYTKAGKSRIGIRTNTRPTARNLAGRIKDNSYMFK